MVLVQDPARLDEVEVVLGSPVPGQLQHPVQVVANPAVLGRLLAGALEAIELAHDLLLDGVGHSGLLDAVPVLGGGVALLAQLLFDRGHLLAEQELALLLLHPVADLVPDRLLEGHLGERVAGPRNQPGEPLLDVQLLQQLDLLLDREVG